MRSRASPPCEHKSRDVAAAATASCPHVRDDREAPLLRDRTMSQRQLILPRKKSKNLRKRAGHEFADLPGRAVSKRNASSPGGAVPYGAVAKFGGLTTIAAVRLPHRSVYYVGRIRDGVAMPASSTARMPVRKMPSKVPAPPIEATGAPTPPILSRLSRSAPISVPIEPPI
jgi:hypothetical protein